MRFLIPRAWCAMLHALTSRAELSNAEWHCPTCFAVPFLCLQYLSFFSHLPQLVTQVTSLTFCPFHYNELHSLFHPIYFHWANSIPNTKPFPPHPTMANSAPTFKLTHLASLCHEILIISYPSLELRSSFVAISDSVTLHSPRLPQRGGKSGQSLENTGSWSCSSTQFMATIVP